MRCKHCSAHTVGYGYQTLIPLPGTPRHTSARVGAVTAHAGPCTCMRSQRSARALPAARAQAARHRDALLCRSQLPEQPTCTPKRDAPDARQQPAACCHPPPASGLPGSPGPSCRSPPPSRSRGPRSSCRCCCAASGPACPPRACLRARVTAIARPQHHAMSCNSLRVAPLARRTLACARTGPSTPKILPRPASVDEAPRLPAARLPAFLVAPHQPCPTS